MKAKYLDSPRGPPGAVGFESWELLRSTGTRTLVKDYNIYIYICIYGNHSIFCRSL